MAKKTTWKRGTREDLIKDVAALLRKPAAKTKNAVQEEPGQEFEYSIPMVECGVNRLIVAGGLGTIKLRPLAKKKGEK